MKTKHKWIDQLNDNMFFDLAESSKMLDNVPQNVSYRIIDSIKKECEVNRNIIAVLSDFLRYKKLILAVSVMLFLFIGYILYEYYFIPLNERGAATIVKSEGDIKINKNNKTFKINEIESLKKDFTIITEKNAELNLKIGEKSFTKVSESSEVDIVKLVKKDNFEENVIYLKKGRVDCDIELIGDKSLFKVITSILAVSVEGTKFSVDVSDQQDVKINVTEGKVKVIYNLVKADKKSKINNVIRSQLNDFYDSTQTVFVDDFISINNSEIDAVNNKIKEIIEESENAPGKNINDRNNINNMLINKINQLKHEIDAKNKEFKSNENRSGEKIENRDVTDDIISPENTENINNKNEDVYNSKIVKLNRNEQYKNVAFVYNWDKNTVLDQKLESIKKETAEKIKGTKFYSIPSKNLSTYFKLSGSILFFFNYEEIKSDENLMQYIEQYLNISGDDLISRMNNKKSFYIKNNYEGKNIVLFAGSNSKNLNALIDSYDLEF